MTIWQVSNNNHDFEKNIFKWRNRKELTSKFSQSSYKKKIIITNKRQERTKE